MKHILQICTLLFLICSCGEEVKVDPHEEENHQSDSVAINVEFPGISFQALSSMTQDELQIARNSIYAQHGKSFASEDMAAHFKNEEWYKVNKNYKDDLLSKKDLLTIDVIKCWEGKSTVHWEKSIDLDGDGEIEHCYFVQMQKEADHYLLINEHSIKVSKNWISTDEDFEVDQAPEDWIKFYCALIDIDKNDNNKEIHVYQYQTGWEDPGLDNLIVSLVDGELVVNELNASDYNSGGISIDGTGVLDFTVSFCPETNQFYELEKGKLKMIREEKGDEPEGGCPACFTADAMVSVSTSKSIPIGEVKKGTKVLTLDPITNELKTAEVEAYLSVNHSELVRLTFENEVITVTLDHPFYLKDKGWSSFDPKATKDKYANFNLLSIIEVGDLFQSFNGKFKTLEEIEYVNSQTKTYTITKLKNGNSFFVNGVLVGVELIKDRPDLP